MVDAALQFADDPNQKLLADRYDAPGARKIERFIKPASFSKETTPSLAPPPPKRRHQSSNGDRGSPAQHSPGAFNTPPSRNYQYRNNSRSQRGRGNYSNHKPVSPFQYFGRSPMAEMQSHTSTSERSGAPAPSHSPKTSSSVTIKP